MYQELTPLSSEEHVKLDKPEIRTDTDRNLAEKYPLAYYRVYRALLYSSE